MKGGHTEFCGDIFQKKIVAELYENEKVTFRDRTINVHSWDT